MVSGRWNSKKSGSNAHFRTSQLLLDSLHVLFVQVRVHVVVNIDGLSTHEHVNHVGCRLKRRTVGNDDVRTFADTERPDLIADSKNLGRV